MNRTLWLCIVGQAFLVAGLALDGAAATMAFLVGCWWVVAAAWSLAMEMGDYRRKYRR